MTTTPADDSLDPSFAHPSSNPVEMHKFLTMGEPAFLAEKRPLPSITSISIRNSPSEKPCAAPSITGPASGASLHEEFREQPYEPANVFYVSSMTILMLLGLRRRWRINPATALPYLVLICIFPLTYYITHPLMDYRQPIEPAIVVLAVAGVIPRRHMSAAPPPLPAESE